MRVKLKVKNKRRNTLGIRLTDAELADIEKAAARETPRGQKIEPSVWGREGLLMLARGA